MLGTHMTITTDDLKKISQLAYIDIENNEEALAKDVTEIMNFVEQLRAVDTKAVAPLYRPFDLHQRLRPDSVTEESCLQELEEIAPLFDDGMYLVPKVIDSGN